MNRMQQVTLDNLRKVATQKEWMTAFYNAIRTHDIVPTPDHRDQGLVLYRAGRLPIEAAAEIVATEGTEKCLSSPAEPDRC